MEIYPAEKYLEILRIISSEKLGVNQIWKLSRYSFKTIITDAIKDLERSGFVQREKMDKRRQQQKEKRQYKQRQFISLTNGGSDFLKLFDQVIQFQKYFNIFLKDFYNFSSCYDKIDDKSFQNVLKSRGWESKDIADYNKNYDNLWLFFRIFQYNFLQFLSVRYSILLSKLKPTRVTTSLTVNILVTCIEGYNKNIQKIFPLYIEEEKDSIDLDQKYYDLYEDLTAHGLSSVYEEHWSFPKSMDNMVEDLMMSLLLILNPPTELIKKVVGDTKNIYRDPVVKAFNNLLKEEKVNLRIL